MIFFRKGKNKGLDEDVDEEEEEIDYVLFQGAINGQDANLAANARLAEAGLVPTKELVTDALTRRSEMILLEPKGGGSVVKMFVDGIGYPGGRLSKQRGLAVTQMLKLLSGLDVRERKKPQQGGINAEYQDTKYELRVESSPVAEGAERLTVRIINTAKKLETADDLGFSNDFKAKIRKMASKKSGVILVCGPPNSGTSSTTMGVLRSIDAYMYGIYNIADLGGRDIIHVTTFEVKEGDSLAETIERIIRVEADVVFLDPISDAETAKTIFEMQEKIGFVTEFAAKDAASGILRLIEWLEDPKIVCEGLSGIVSTKLIRILCEKCKQAYRPHPKLLAKVGLPPETKTLYRPPQEPDPDELEEGEEYQPCRKCGGMGYFGRVGLYELIEMSDDMRELITKGPELKEIRAQAKKEKMQTFQQEGLRMVAEGTTALEELQRSFRKS